MTDIHSLPAGKSALRRVMLQRRAEACAKHPDAPRALTINFLKRVSLPPRSIIAGYSALPGEMDVGPLMQALAAKGHVLALPAVIGRGTALLFRLYRTDDERTPGSLGILEPPASAPVTEPDVLLVPLLAFDKARNRLGTGGGYYDRTLAALRQKRPVLAVGVGFASQEVPNVPVAAHDIRLDRIITEIEVF